MMSASCDTITLTQTKSDCSTVIEVIIPRRLGPVRLTREIGRGGMGVVYQGHHELLGRNVAVKFLLGAVRSAEDPAFRGFIEGARWAASVRHPGLTTVHHADVVEGVPYLVMEYVDGLTLRQIVRRNGPLSVPLTLGVLDAAADAIGALHDRGIIHRDVKTSNMLVDVAGVVYVTDFGLLRPPRGQGLTQSPVGIAGTAAYMAPEAFDGAVLLALWLITKMVI